MAGLVVLDNGLRKVVTGVGVTYDSNHQLDAFSRLRVSNPLNLYEYKFANDVDFDLYWSESLTSGGANTYGGDNVSQELAITTTTGSKAVVQSRRRVQYFSGKSHIFHFTGNFNNVQTGVRKRFGLFDDNNGLFFETVDTTLYIVNRSKASGSVVDTRVAQSSWNGDNLDGTGDSGITADPTKQQLFWIDYAWLGSGTVRWGITIDGMSIILHTESYGNVIDFSYMQTAVLPFRAEIEATGSPAATDSLNITCMALEVEGSPAEIGKVRTKKAGLTEISLTATEQVLVIMRIDPANLKSSMRLLQWLFTVTSGNKEVVWNLYFNPTITGTPTWVTEPSSVVQTASNAASLTISGTPLMVDCGYARVGSEVSSNDVDSDLFLGHDISGTPDTFAFTARTLSSSAKCLWVSKRKEYS